MTEIEKLQKELKKCKIGQWILFGTILMVLLVFFSFPILKIFQPKEITIVNQDGEKYKFSIPSDWVYWKTDEQHYTFYDIWDKDNILIATFWGSEQNLKEKYIRKFSLKHSFIIQRENQGFNILEIKCNPIFCKDSGEMFFIESLNCFVFYSGELFQKEKRIKKFLSHWEKVE